MRKKQLWALFLCSLVAWTVGNGLLPLLPVYADQLGAEPVWIGFYLSSAYLALALGSIFAGWLSNKFHRRKTLFVVVGVIGIPTVWLMGRVADFRCLAISTAILWFVGGAGQTLLGIMTALCVEEARRGKVFGVLALTNALGSLIGGLATGSIADRWGYPALFGVVALFFSLYPLLGLLLEDRAATQARKDRGWTREGKSRVGKIFVFFLLAVVMAAVARFAHNIGRSLAMTELGFTSATVSFTVAISGAITLPLPVLISWLSDRVGRKPVIAICYFAGAIGLLVLAISVSLWHFGVAASLMTLSGASNPVGRAWVTDWVPQESLEIGLSLFDAVGWVGGIIGFAGMGYAVQNFGMTSAFVVGAFLPLAAIFLLISIRQVRRKEGDNGVTAQQDGK